MRYRLLTYGKTLLTSTLLLLAIGAVMVYSTSLPVGIRHYQDGHFFFKRHLSHLGLGITLMLLAWFALRSGRINLRGYVYPATVLGLILLAAVLYSPWGLKVHGAQRWLGHKAGFSFQPVEISKFCLLFYLAHFLARTFEKPQSEDYYFLALGLGVLPALYLLIRQPDLGNTLILAIVTIILLFLARVRLIYLASLCLLGLCTGTLWLASIPYVEKRLLAFLNPWQHPSRGGFQLTQSFLALGNGGFWGLGLGAGQQKLAHLPEAHTDFILAVIGAEWGMLGTGAIILLFALFIWSGLKIAATTPDLFTAYLAAGISSFIGVQALVNIGVVTGLLPTKGLPLPFISYGGTSLVVNLIGVGALLALATQKQPQKRAARVARYPLGRR